MCNDYKNIQIRSRAIKPEIRSIYVKAAVQFSSSLVDQERDQKTLSDTLLL